MFDDKTGLNSEIKFAVGATYEAFHKTWGELSSNKVSWVNTWSEWLDGIDIKTIQHATEFCIQNLDDAPNLPVFIKYCTRIKNKERLTDPIVSNIERMARKILEIPANDMGHKNYCELADACLIVAAIAQAKACSEVDIKWNEEIISSELVGRANMFGMESLKWKKDALHGKGYWCDILNE